MTDFEKIHLKLSDISKTFNKVADQMKKQGAEILKVSKSLNDLERNVEAIKNKMTTKEIKQYLNAQFGTKKGE